MKIIRSKEFTANRPWGALDIANMSGITTRLHWTDQPYKWHINDGEEVFVVLDGQVEMRYRDHAGEQSVMLFVGDIFYASIGTEHVAHPLGAARILMRIFSRRAGVDPARLPANFQGIFHGRLLRAMTSVNNFTTTIRSG